MSRRNAVAGASLSAYDSIFGGTDEEVMSSEVAKEKVEGQIVEVPLNELHEFKNHPFRVIDDEKMAETVDSIKEYGVLVPGIARPRPEGGYEILAGHRRRHASELAGKETMPMIIKDVSDDEAVLIMVDSNIQREELLPSEKAFAYKMKMEAMRRQGTRTDLTSAQNDQKLIGSTSRSVLAEQFGVSGAQVSRYIRLTELLPELLDLVDKKRLQFTVAVEISYIDPEVQKWIYEYIRENGQIKLNQITALSTQMQMGAISQSKMIAILNNSLPGRLPSPKLTFTEKKLREYFPSGYSVTQMRSVIEDLLAEWKMNQEEKETNEV